MEIIPQLISRYSNLLYPVCGIACAYFLLTGMASLRDLRRAVFRLERNAVVSRMVGSLMKAVLCLVAGGVIYAVSNMAPPTDENSLLASATGTPSGIVIPTSLPTAVITPGQALAAMNVTPTVVVLIVDAAGNTVTPDPSQVGAMPAGDATATSEPTITPTELPALEATLTPEASPTVAPELMADCSNPSAQITNPAPGEEVSGAYSVRGTAVLETGGWYQIEIMPPGAAQWEFIARGDATVTGGVLFENFNAFSFGPGIYPFRLVLIGPDGNMRAYCRVPITIASPS